MNSAISRLLACALIGAAVPAAAAPAWWSAGLAKPLESPRSAIVNSVMWKCAGDQCSAPAQDSRPLLVCQKVARKFGTVTRFVSPAGALSADELAKCNAG